MNGHIEPMVGRYVHVEIDREMHRIYFEESGAGIPLVCLHTAGSDGRQWRHPLAAGAVSEKIPHIAVAMPSRGALVLNLRSDHAAGFRALIGLEAADFQAPWYDTTWLNRPDVHGGEVCAALVSGLIAPQSPEVSRNETLWAYKRGGPGVFKGDLYFYRVDGDLRGRVETIDTRVCPLYLLTGEYDFSCTPEDTTRTAAAIAGARVTIMEQLGHFPMSENPEQFRRYIAPVLGEILTQSVPTRQGVHA